MSSERVRAATGSEDLGRERTSRPVGDSRLRGILEDLKGSQASGLEDLKLSEEGVANDRLSKLREVGELFKSEPANTGLGRLRVVREDLASGKAPSRLDRLKDVAAQESATSETIREIREAFKSPVRIPAAPRPKKKEEESIKEMDPGMTKKEAQELDQELSKDLMVILTDKDMSARQKAKRFIKRLGFRLKSGAKHFLWTFAAKWINQNGYNVIKTLAAGTVGALIFSFLGPLLLGGTAVGGLLGYSAVAGGLKGAATLAVSALANGLGASTISLGGGFALDYLAENEMTRPFLTKNLLKAPAIQSLLEKLRVPEGWREVSIMDIARTLLNNLPALMPLASATTIAMGKPDDPWTNFAYSKGLQYFIMYGIPLVGSAYAATKAMVVKMFEVLQDVPSQVIDSVKNSELLNATETKLSQVLTGRLASAPGEPVPVSETVPALLEDIVNPEVKAQLPLVLDATLRKSTETFDRAVEKQVKDLPPVLSGAITNRRPIKRVEQEKATNLAFTAAGNLLQSSALISGAFIVAMMASRSANPETMAKILPDAFGEAAKTAAKQAIQNAQTHITYEMLTYQLLANVIGVNTLVQRLAGKLPESVQERLTNLSRQIGDATEGVSNEKHPLVREFFSVLIGRKIYSVNEVNKMKQEDLVKILEAAGTKFDPKKRIPPIGSLREAVMRLQKQNVQEVHQVVFKALIAQASGLGVSIAVRNSTTIMEQGRKAVEFIVNNETIRKTIGLTDLETASIKTQLTYPVEKEPLQVTVPGTIKDDTKEVAEQNGPEWKAAATGMEKIESFLGVVVPGQVTQEVLTREQYRNAFAQSKGYKDWNDMKQDLAVKTGMKEREASLRETEADREKQRAERREAALRDRAHAFGYDTDEEYRKSLEDRRKWAEELKKRDREQTLKRLADERAMRQAAQAEKDAALFKAELEKAIKENPKLKNLGLDKNLDKVLATDKGPIKLFPTAVDVVEHPEVLLDPELAKALDTEILPLAFYALDRGLQRVEQAGASSVPVVGWAYALYDEVRQEYNNVADLNNAVMFTGSALGAALRSNESTKNSRLARLMPKGGPESYLPRMKSLTEAIMQNTELRQRIEEQKINPMEVVATAYAKHLIWGTSRGEMFGEIAGVIIAGKNGAAAGAATGDAAVKIAKLGAEMTQKLGMLVGDIA